MDYFNDVLTVFLGLDHGRALAVYEGSESSRDFIKNILICALKMNEALTGLERHEGGQRQHFWVNYPFNSQLWVYIPQFWE